MLSFQSVSQAALACTVALALFGQVAHAAPATQLLLDNGPLITGVGNAPDGSDTSSVQTSQNLGVTGFAHAFASSTRVADFFVVPDSGWVVQSLEFFLFQPNTQKLTPTITALNVRISQNVVVWGDTYTNVLGSVDYAGFYRITGNHLDDMRRPVMLATVQVPSVALAPGGYALDWQAEGGVTGGPYVPPVTIAGQIGSGGAQQYRGNGWNVLGDGGASVALPFRIRGTLDKVFANGFE